MGALLVLLVITNLLTLGVAAWLLLRPIEDVEADAVLGAGLDAAPGPRSVGGHPRRVISIEILNPIELAGSRSRVAGIAGSLAPGITRRLVHEQALKQIRRDIKAQGVIADVRLHVIKPADSFAEGVSSPAPRGPSVDPRSKLAPLASPAELDGTSSVSPEVITFEGVEYRGA